VSTHLPKLDFYRSPPHECAYLPARSAGTVFADPEAVLTVSAYSILSSMGFRRSGAHVYRPACATCQACTAVRVPVRGFVPNRQQRRTLQRNQDLLITERPAQFDEEHFALYRSYIEARHPGSGMSPTDPEQYLGFLSCSWADTRFYEFRTGAELLAVAVVDHLQDALSAVYTFFAPEQASRSLGRFAVLKQIEWAREARLNWLYLGYHIAESRKMRYKAEYRPQQRLLDDAWRDA
jgi:arginyl-tRNA--protein-N-Asp/Glu arginylyltransferase